MFALLKSMSIQLDIPEFPLTQPLPLDRARCSDGEGGLAHLFFSDHARELARAKAICSRCRLAEDCLEGALQRGEYYGVWGGQLLMEGVIVEDRPRRGRPPKEQREMLVVDEVPVPPHLVA